MLSQITSVQNPLIKHLVKLRHNRDYRYEHQSLIIEGIKPIAEISRQLQPKTLLTLDETLIPEGVSANETFVVNESVMKKISVMSSPEGLIAEFPMPKPAEFKKVHRLIALDGISDPGNLGTILRTALAFNWDGAFILGESCDPYNEKALRAARGATFRLPIAWGSWADLKKIVDDHKLQAVVADLKGTPLRDFPHPQGILLTLGNEAHGPSPEMKGFCQPLTIAMPGKMESLNVSVAAGILLYQLSQS